jgi:ferrochelatase
MAANCDYVAQLRHTGGLIARLLEMEKWDLVYQSRSGSPMQPWLGPDICDHLKTLRAEGVTDVVIAPIGFVSDHMEVVYDVDVEARRVADEIGIRMVRAATAGTHPAFVRMIRELILERVNDEVAPNLCAPDCCRLS